MSEAGCSETGLRPLRYLLYADYYTDYLGADLPIDRNSKTK